MYTTPDDFEVPGGDEAASGLLEAEGVWTASDFAEWERAREEAWATWPPDPAEWSPPV